MKAAAKILVVDDEPVICRSCQRILAEEGYTADTAERGRDALRRLKREQYDVLLLDLKMVEISGLDVLKEVKASGLDTAVIVITGYATLQTAVEAMKLGAFDYISKPFTPDELTLVVRNALERKGSANENRRLRCFVAEWSERARKALQSHDLTPDERVVLDSGDLTALAQLLTKYLLVSEGNGASPD